MTEWLRDKKIRAVTALFIGMAASLLVCGIPGEISGRIAGKISESRKASQAKEVQLQENQWQNFAWWGTLYPEFCFSRKDEDGKVKISFWLAQVLDW